MTAVCNTNPLAWWGRRPIRWLPSWIARRASRVGLRVLASAATPDDAAALASVRPPLGARVYAVHQAAEGGRAMPFGGPCIVRRFDGDGVSLLFEQPLIKGGEYTLRIPEIGRAAVARVESCAANGSGRYFFAVRMRWLAGVQGTPSPMEAPLPDADEIAAQICG